MCALKLTMHHPHGLYSREESGANDSDDPFADMREVEEDEVAIDDELLATNKP